MKKEGVLPLFIISAMAVIWISLLVTGGLPLKLYLVQSGSMEPSIMTGDVILVKKEQSYELNQVVTFTDSTLRVVTHRIVSKNTDDSFVTKGDANKDDDRETISKSQLIGKVFMTLPKIGYIANFMKTSVGFLLMVLVPAIFLLVGEIINIAKELRRKR